MWRNDNAAAWIKAARVTHCGLLSEVRQSCTMYKSMDTTPPFSAKEGILFPNLLTFVHGIEVLFYVALSCTKLFVRLVYFMWPYPTLIFTKNWILFDIIEYTCEAKNRRYNEIHYVPLSQYMSWKGQLRHIICVFELPFTLLIIVSQTVRFRGILW